MSEWIRKIGEARSIPGISHRMIYCTPELAALILTLNTHNRKISRNIVIKYITELKNGDWLPVASGIGIDESGVLADGQHRLAAIVESGVTAPLLVVWGLPTRSQEKVDRQFKRSLAVALKLSGMNVMDKGVHVATFFARQTSRIMPADSEVVAEYRCHQEAIAAVIGKLGHSHKGITAVGVMAALVRAWEMDAVKTMEFVEKLKRPTELTSDDPRYRLLVWAADVANHPAGGLARQESDYRSACFAINAYFAGRKISAVRKADELIPPSDQAA